VNSTSISLLNGGHFDYECPERSRYDITDIARGLSHTARFSGQTARAYSVAQHSVIVSKVVPEEHALAGLLHDSVEAFMADVPSPLKRLLPGYIELEKRAEADLCKRFGVKFPLHACVKDADIKVFLAERRDMQPCVKEECYVGYEAYPNSIIAWDSHMSYIYFMRRFDELTKGRK
jgi:5'-deoxynucleotidase YfbR-like HD superfamily hydrolase